MESKRVATVSAVVAGIAFILLAGGTLLDLKIADMFFFRDNAFGKLYECIGKMPAFVIAVFACVLLARNAWEKQNCKWRRIAYLIIAYLAGVLCFMDLGEAVSGSTKIALAIGSVLSVPLCVVAYKCVQKAQPENLPELKKWAVYALFCVAVIGVLVFVIKTIWGRERYVDLQTQGAAFTPWYKPAGKGGDSFPSGHAAFAATLFLLLPLTQFSHIFSGKFKTVFTVASVFTAVTMIARISDGHHYLSDVTVGFIVSYAVQIAVLFISYGKNLNRVAFDENVKIERLLNAVL